MRRLIFKAIKQRPVALALSQIREKVLRDKVESQSKTTLNSILYHDLFKYKGKSLRAFSLKLLSPNLHTKDSST